MEILAISILIFYIFWE